MTQKGLIRRKTEQPANQPTNIPFRIEIIFTQLNGFKYSYLTVLIICFQVKIFIY